MGDEADADWQDGLVEWGIEDARAHTGKFIPYKGVRVRKTRPGEIEQVKASIEKIKKRRAVSLPNGERG